MQVLRPSAVGLVLGVLLGSVAFTQPIGVAAQIPIALALATTYLSIGVLVGLIPTSGPRWFFGLVVGVLYSVPGAIFVTVPYPLQADAHPFWNELAAGDAFDFVMTLVVGGVVGLLAGVAKPSNPEAIIPEPDSASREPS